MLGSGMMKILIIPNEEMDNTVITARSLKILVYS